MCQSPCCGRAPLPNAVRMVTNPRQTKSVDEQLDHVADITARVILTESIDIDPHVTSRPALKRLRNVESRNGPRRSANVHE